MADTDSIAKIKAYQKVWREANKEKLKEYGSRYYADNKERYSEKAAENYQANKDRYKKKAADWAQKNPERRYEIANSWRKENPEIYRKARQKDRAANHVRRDADAKEYRAKNPEIVRKAQKNWKLNNPEACAHHVGLRRTRLLQALPQWADLEAIKAIYRRASELKAMTGKDWHVDHEIPLKHALVCGLHNEFNLRVIEAHENQKKKNKFSIC